MSSDQVADPTKHALATHERTPAPAGSANAGQSQRRRVISILVHVIQLGPVLVLAVLWVGMTFASPYFMTTLNLSNLLQAAAVPAALALGQLFVILTGGIDLSSGAVTVLAAAVGAKFAHGASPNGALTILIILMIGTGAGIANGILIEYVRLSSPFVVTLGTFSVCTGITYVVLNGATITGMPHLIDEVGGTNIAGTQIPIAALVVLAVAGCAYVLSKHIQWGKWVYALGGNREAANRAGIPVRKMVVSVFALSGLAAGLAAVFTAGLTNSAAPTIDFTTDLDAISAVVVGGAALTGGRGTVWGTIVGALILETIHNALNLLNVNTNWEPIVLGCVLLAAVGLERARSRLEAHLRLVEARLAGDV